MVDRIVPWLAERLGYIFDLSTRNCANAMKTGVLVADILYSYGIFSEDQVNQVVDDSMNQLEVYKTYLSKMGIVYNEDIHNKIASGDVVASIELLYHLYLRLQDTDKLQHIAISERKKSVLNAVDRFSITPVCEEAMHGFKQEVHPFSAPLKNMEDVITWHKEKHLAFIEKCRIAREEYILQLKLPRSDKDCPIRVIQNHQMQWKDKPAEYGDFDNASVDFTYDELKSNQKKYQDIVINQPSVDEAKKLLAKIKLKLKRKLASDADIRKLKRSLLNKYWDQILKQQQETFEDIVIKEVLKQTIFEKQMVRRVFEIRQQKETMLQCRCDVDIEIRRKIDEELWKDFFHSDVKNQEKENLYYLEKNRACELQARLQEEKERLKLEKITEKCRTIVSDLTDMAMYISEYNSNYLTSSAPMNKLYLSTLFQFEKPIFDIILPIEDILTYDPGDSEEMAEIYDIELSRHQTIMHQLLEDYLELQWPWCTNLGEVFTEEELELWQLGHNVLGYIVHRLLLTKYPKPVPPPPPDVPDVPIAVCINGLKNPDIILPLTEILRDRRIQVVQMQDAINYCLNVFKEEATDASVNVLFDRLETGVRGLQKHRDMKAKALADVALKLTAKLKKHNECRLSRSLSLKQAVDEYTSEEAIVTVKIQEPTFYTRGDQTPKTFDDGHNIYSPAGDLGKLAYEILNAAETLNTYLVVKMFVQYLISLKAENIGGWVLVNFPNTFLDAAQLEEALSSIAVTELPETKEDDLDDYVKIEDRFDVPANQIAEEENKKKRISYIVPNPIVPENPKYQTSLTAFIALKQIFDVEEWESNNLLNDAPTDPLVAFYINQGCEYDVIFKLWDFNTLKTLAKVITNDLSLPKDESMDVLGPSLDYLENALDICTGIDMTPIIGHITADTGDEPSVIPIANLSETEVVIKVDDEVDSKKVKENKVKKGGKGGKGKKDGSKGKGKKGGSKGKGSSKSKKSKKSKSGKSSLLPLVYHKETQVPEVDEKKEIEEVNPARPGEITWRYAMCSIPDEFQCALATLWENIEEVYTNDLKELFFKRRVLLDKVTPYTAFIKIHMTRFITRPDMKQKYLQEFQNQYNNLDEDMRDDDEVKAEFHCRINEFKKKLIDICDERMNENERERRRLIEDNFNARIIVEIINIKIMMMQIEIDSYVDTLRLVTEYYYGMVTKQPATDIVFNKYQIKKVTYSEETPENIVVTIISNTDQLLKSEGPITESSLTPYYDIISNIHKLPLEFVTQTYESVTRSIAKLADALKPKQTGKKEAKPKSPGKKKNADAKRMPMAADPCVSENAEGIAQEHKDVAKAIYIAVRVRLYVNLLACKKLFGSVLQRNKECFLYVYQLTEHRYRREKHSVELACSILSRAVEAECKIQTQLQLSADQFLIEPDVLLFEDDLPNADDILMERSNKYLYSVGQLQDTHDLFKIYGPKGFISERLFANVIQDIVSHNPEDGSPWLIPLAWRDLKPLQVSMLLHDLFGNVEHIDWREYILFNAGLRFPNTHDILAMREKCREMDCDGTEFIYEHQYQAVTLWFEKPRYSLDEPVTRETILRRKLLKRLLWNCYSIDEHRINYMSLLFGLCKDKHIVNGIAKAFSLAMGREVCSKYEVGEMYLEAELEKRKSVIYKAACKQVDHEHTIRISREIVQEMVTSNIGEPTLLEGPETSQILDESANKDDNAMFICQSYNDQSGAIPAGIDFDFENDFLYPNVEYILPFDVMINVFTVSLPSRFAGHIIGDKSMRENIEKLFNSLRIPELNDEVFVHRFLYSPQLRELFKNVTKFSEKYPANTVLQLLENSYY